MNTVPLVHERIAMAIAANDGIFFGTTSLCEQIQANERWIYRSLHSAPRFGLIRKQNRKPCCGRGHKTIWVLTPKGRKYVQSK
jgi:hypothetical protein